MALHTEIEREGELRTINWGWWHVQRMQEVAIVEENGLDPATVTLDQDFWRKIRDTALYTKGEHVAQGDHHFLDESDGEKFSILAGDILRMHR